MAEVSNMSQQSASSETVDPRSTLANEANQALLIAIGAFPPPITGQSKNMALIASDMERIPGLRVIRRSNAGGSIRRTPASVFRKLRRLSLAWATIVTASPFWMNKTVYVVSDGGKGLAYTLFTVNLAHLFGYRIVLQHRTFQYVDQFTPRMAAINRKLRDGDFHVFLTAGMALRFFERYGEIRGYVVNHNLAQFGTFWREMRAMPRQRSPEGTVTIGYLSNLLPEKGFDTVIEVARLSAREGLPYRFILAGPPANDTIAGTIKTAEAEMQNMLEHVGPVYGLEKTAFYRQLDVFLFPTRYRYEAQPNVVLEAASAGNIVIATDRGTIAEDLALTGSGTTIPKDREANAQAFLEAIKTHTSDDRILTKRKAKILRNTRQAIENAKAGYGDFLSRIADRTDPKA